MPYADHALRRLSHPVIGLKKEGTELYNLETDPFEMKDLSRAKPEVTEELTAMVEKWASTLPREYIKKKKKRDK